MTASPYKRLSFDGCIYMVAAKFGTVFELTFRDVGEPIRRSHRDHLYKGAGCKSNPYMARRVVLWHRPFTNFRQGVIIYLRALEDMDTLRMA